MKSGVMTLSVVSPRRRSIPAPRERNGLKELTACEGVTSTTMLFGGAPRCAKAAAGESKTIAPQRLRFVENMLLLRRPAGRVVADGRGGDAAFVQGIEPANPGSVTPDAGVVENRRDGMQLRREIRGINSTMGGVDDDRAGGFRPDASDARS